MTGGASPRKRGDYFEYQTRDDLVKRGWVVGRSAGSHGSFDLVALRNGMRPLLVSCKTDGYIPPGQRRKLLDDAVKSGARAIMAHRPARGKVAYARVYASIKTVRLPADDDAESAESIG